MPPEVRIGDKTVRAGQSAVVDLGDGVPVRVHVFCGEHAGPRFFVAAGLHGGEGLGCHIAREVCAAIEPRELSGVIYVVPNALAGVPRGGKRGDERGAGSPAGALDLDRCFPGKPDGSELERLAHRLFKDVARRCDYGLLLHDPGDGRLGLPHARGHLANHHVRRMCESFGSTMILDTEGAARSLRRLATTYGVPTFEYEAGHVGRSDKHVLSECVRGVFGVMSDLRMLSHEIPWRGAPTILRDARWAQTRHAGRIENLALPGHTVRAGEIVARVEGEAVHSPKAGLVLTASHQRAVREGGSVVEVASVVEQSNGRPVGTWEA